MERACLIEIPKGSPGAMCAPGPKGRDFQFEGHPSPKDYHKPHTSSVMYLTDKRAKLR
jgi:hypothetical protein